jgi:hypothetical protein
LRHKLAGKYWEVKYVPNLGSRGLCDPPTKKNKTVTIWQGLKGQELMEVLLHELIHCVMYRELDEDFVTEVADDISRAIWKELKAKGYLKDD